MDHGCLQCEWEPHATALHEKFSHTSDIDKRRILEQTAECISSCLSNKGWLPPDNRYSKNLNVLPALDQHNRNPKQMLLPVPAYSYKIGPHSDT